MMEKIIQSLTDDELRQLDRLLKKEFVKRNLASSRGKHMFWDLGLSVGAYKRLKANGINSLEDLQGYTSERLLKIPSFGSKRLAEIQGLMLEYGLSLDASDAIAANAKNEVNDY